MFFSFGAGGSRYVRLKLYICFLTCIAIFSQADSNLATNASRGADHECDLLGRHWHDSSFACFKILITEDGQDV